MTKTISPPTTIEAVTKSFDGERQTQSLCCLPKGIQARVVSVTGSGAVARRLMEMGIVPGALVCIIKHAPLGDPIQVRVRGFHLALRRSEAQTIKVIAQEGV